MRAGKFVNVTSCVLMLMATQAVAELHGRLPLTPGGADFRAYYDDVQDITWLANANLAATNTFGLPYDTWLGEHPGDSNYGSEYPGDGQITSTGQMHWVAALHFLEAMNNANYLGVSGWRLPQTPAYDPSCSRQSELWNVDRTERIRISDQDGCLGSEMGYLTNVYGVLSYAPGPFQNVASYFYWSGEFAANPYASAWDLHFGTSIQGFRGKAFTNYVWPVIDGDIAEPTVLDIDQDGFPDEAELNGMDVDGDGVVDLDLPALGADPCRKTIVVEIDYMDGSITGLSHTPHPDLVARMQTSFDGAPLEAVEDCPYDGFPTADAGVNFVAYVDDQIPEQSGRFDPRTELADVRDVYFDETLLPFVHYAVYAHAIDDGSSTSGVCCNQGGFIVSLGNWGLANADSTLADVDFFDPAGDQDLRLVIEAGTFMHELGHSLGLGHGGADNINFKPNYLSIMNYTFQTRGILQSDDPARINIDYSRALLPDLDERALREEDLLCTDTDCEPLLTGWRTGGNSHFSDITTETDWNDSGSIDVDPVVVDINRGDTGNCVGDGSDDVMTTLAAGDDVLAGSTISAGLNTICETLADPTGDDSQLAPVGSRPDVLHIGHDDWQAVRFLAEENAYGDGVAAYEVNDSPEIEYAEARELGEFWDEVRARMIADQNPPPSLSLPEHVVLEGNDPRGWSGDLAEAASVTAVHPDGETVSLTSDAMMPIRLGVTEVEWTATGESGGTATALQTIDVVDTVPPSLSVPVNVEVTATGTMTQVQLGEATADDLYGVSVNNDAPDGFAIGDTVVTWVATDANGNTTSATQLVSVLEAPDDSEPPQHNPSRCDLARSWAEEVAQNHPRFSWVWNAIWRLVVRLFGLDPSICDATI